VTRDDYQQLENPVLRFEFTQNADAARISAIDREFLAGNWSVFAVWVQLVTAGKIGPSKSPPDSPHARFWTAFLSKAPPEERDAFLRFLVRTRALHAGRASSTAPTLLLLAPASFRGWIVRYCEAFEKPAHTLDPEARLGQRLVYRSHYPDELTVALSGDLGIVEARPHLERFVRAQRRFYRLDTDYATQPEEVGDLFETSLAALVDLAPLPGQKKPVRDFLDVEKERLSKPPKDGSSSSDATGEWVTLETVISYEEHSSDSVTLVSAHGDPKLSKVPGLEAALRRLANPQKGSRLPADARTLLPEASWARPAAISAALEGRAAMATIAKRRLYFLDQSIGAINVKTGHAVFEHTLEDPTQTRGLKACARVFAFDDAGDLLIPAAVAPSTRSRGEKDRSVVLVVDADTGDIKQELPVATSASMRHGPDFFGLLGDSLVFAERGRAFRQSRAGKVLWEQALSDGAVVRTGAGRMAVLSNGKVEIMNARGETVLSTALASLAPKAGPEPHVFDDEVLLLENQFVFFARYQHVFAADYQGKLRWSGEIKEQWREPPRRCGEAICLRTERDLTLFPLDGTPPLTVRAPELIREYAVEGSTAYILGDTKLHAIDLKTRAARRVIARPMTHMDHLAGVSEGMVVLLVDESSSRFSGYFLLGVPAK
jgi:hypothetical protein